MVGRYRVDGKVREELATLTGEQISAFWLPMRGEVSRHWQTRKFDLAKRQRYIAMKIK